MTRYLWITLVSTTLVSATLVLATGCVEPDFEAASRVSRPRVLAVIAQRPEVRPGEDARVRAVVAGADGRDVELRWTMCLAGGAIEAGGFGGAGAFGTSGAQQFGAALTEPGCDARSPFTTPLEVVDGEARVPGECLDLDEPWRCTRGLAQLFVEVGERGGAPPELLAALVDSVGVALTVNVDLYVDGVLEERAFKRIGITARAELTSNPPPPRFAVGDVWLSARDADPHTCVPERGERPVVSGLSEVQLRPDPDDAAWQETYPVLSVDGSFTRGEENSYYSWFSTEGEHDPEISVAPVRDSVWLTPEAEGLYSLWLVVRDGHLGASACRAEVEVVGGVPAFTGVGRL